MTNTKEKDILKFLTSGSVDDGKSTFLGRLLYDSGSVFTDQLEEIKKTSEAQGNDDVDLSLLVDGLESERTQKITIDVAYRYFQTKKRKFVIADAPGHEEYTRNMAVAASNSDLAIILIDASAGVKKQTLRHSYISSLFGIKKAVVAINKMDLINFDQRIFDKIVKDYKVKTKNKLNFDEIKFIPISAISGDNVVNKGKNMKWYKGQTIMEILETTPIPREHTENLRLAIQNLTKYKNKRYIYGRVTSGEIKVGEEVKVLPAGQTAKVSEIFYSSQEVNKAQTGDSISISLDQEIDMERGGVVISKSKRVILTNNLIANLIWFDQKTYSLNHDREYLIKINHNKLNAKISKINYRLNVNDLNHEKSKDIIANDIVSAELTLSKEIACDTFINNKYTGSFLLIDKETNLTVACGLVDEKIHSKELENKNKKDDKFLKELLSLCKTHYGKEAKKIYNKLTNNF